MKGQGLETTAVLQGPQLRVSKGASNMDEFQRPQRLSIIHWPLRQN